MEVVRGFDRYHRMFREYTQRGGKVGSSLDRGAFTRPHEVLPEEARFLLGEGRRSGSFAYGPEAGDDKLREKIAEVENRRHGTFYSPDNVAMLPGAWSGIVFAIEEILNLKNGKMNKEKIAIIGPTLYLMFQRIIRDYGIEVNAYDFVVPGTERVPTSMDDMECVFADRPKMIVITNPNNPDGKYFPPALLREVIERAGQEGIYIIMDEIQNCFPRRARIGYSSWIQAPNVVRMDSASKAYALAEYKTGWMIAEPRLLGDRMDGIISRMSGIMGNAPRAANTALLYLLNRELERIATGVDYLSSVHAKLTRKEEFVLAHLAAMDNIIEIILPHACINLTVQVAFDGTDMELAKILMENGTLLMPASGYGHSISPPTLRITFAERQEKVEHSMAVLERVLGGYVS
ncbi:MAG: pyridoxal phosphate-dependent aminotransferase [Candidatus Micrarchaeota archaeon]